ncbi:hypothetical protein N330309_062 [Synechococcus phage S-CAM1]|jgi:hypothetical protein|uniref:Uncharacterized protein n=1 Tax=Synechococcus phage S-CAM1 TaxID=754037 RepID=A0A1D8KF93_9CAUD|nr:hypothetical protein N330309_062 [Synechococcus phage S-CAM1]
MKQNIITRSYTDSKGNTWEWDETPETRQAIQKLHQTIQSNLEAQADDYGVGK